MMRRQSGMISVWRRKLITSESSICMQVGGMVASRVVALRDVHLDSFHTQAHTLTHLDERPNDAETREAQVLERSVFAHGVEERVEVQRNVRCRGDATQKGEKGRGRHKKRTRVSTQACSHPLLTPHSVRLSSIYNTCARRTIEKVRARLCVRRHAL